MLKCHIFLFEIKKDVFGNIVCFNYFTQHSKRKYSDRTEYGVQFPTN